MKKIKVKCTAYKAEEKFFTVGKVYEWIDGKLKEDNGFSYTHMVKGTDPKKWELSKYYEFELVNEKPKQEIHITVKGLKTIAVLKENGKVISRAESNCNPEDKFSFETGSEIALKRLFGNEPFFLRFSKALKNYVKTMKAEDTKFLVGDKVTVSNWGYRYSTYDEWFKKNAPALLNDYKRSQYKRIDGVYTVKKVAPHGGGESYEGRTLYAIKNKEGLI